MKKHLITGLVITAFTTGALLPQETYAKEAITPLKNLEQQAENIHYDLGPTGLNESVATTMSSLNALNYHAEKMFSQRVPDLRNIKSINRDLQERMYTHQVNSKLNGLEWIDTIRPLVTKSSQNITDYNDTFQLHYNTLMTAIKQKDGTKLENELTLLYNDILENKNQSDQLIEKLKIYRNKITEDTKNFKDDVSQLSTTLTSTNLGIPMLQRQINDYNQQINDANILINSGAALCASVIGLSFGLYMITSGKDQIKNSEQQIESLKTRISGIEKEIVILTDVQNKFSNTAQTIDTAIVALQNVSNNWHTIASKYSSLLADIKSINPEKFSFIQTDLNIAKNSWQDLKNYTELVNQNLNNE